VGRPSAEPERRPWVIGFLHDFTNKDRALREKALCWISESYPACIYGFAMYAILTIIAVIGLRAKKIPRIRDESAV
jgi:hypothetical protein